MPLDFEYDQEDAKKSIRTITSLLNQYGNQEQVVEIGERLTDAKKFIEVAEEHHYNRAIQGSDYNFEGEDAAKSGQKIAYQAILKAETLLGRGNEDSEQPYKAHEEEFEEARENLVQKPKRDLASFKKFLEGKKAF